MVKDQLFRKYIPDNVFYTILSKYGIKELNEKYLFTRQHLQNINTLNNIVKLKPILEKYYLPCKARTYLNDLNYKNIITILRQILKTRSYTLKSIEKYQKGEKSTSYHIFSINKNNYEYNSNKLIYKEKKIVIMFD